MTDLTERLIALRQEGGDAAAMRLLDEAANRLTELEDERNAIGDELVAARVDNDRLIPENKRLREALEVALDHLSNQCNCLAPGHQCGNCAARGKAHAALHPGVSEGAPASGAAEMTRQRLSGAPDDDPACGSNQPDRSLADSECPDASKRTINEPTFPHERCPTIPREAIEKEVEAALDDLDRMPASIYFRDEGIAASYRERLDAARGRLSALLSEGDSDG